MKNQALTPSAKKQMARELLAKVRSGESQEESYYDGRAIVSYVRERDGIYRYERGPDGQNWGSRRLPG